MKAKVCGKCGNNPMWYIEVWSGFTISFSIDNDGYVMNDGEQAVGNPTHVEAVCLCGHRWRLKKINQITELEKPVSTTSPSSLTSL